MKLFVAVVLAGMLCVSGCRTPGAVENQDTPRPYSGVLTNADGTVVGDLTW